MDQISVNAIVFKDDAGLWVAHCVDYDIVATAKTPNDVVKAFAKAVAANVCVNIELGRSGLESIAPAPERIRSLYASGTITLSSNEPLPSNSFVRIEDMRLVEADMV